MGVFKSVFVKQSDLMGSVKLRILWPIFTVNTAKNESLVDTCL